MNNGLKAILALGFLLLVLGLGGSGVAVGCGGSDQESEAKKELASLCESTTDGDSQYCSCVADELIGRGYDTPEEISTLKSLVLSVDQSGDLTQLPTPVVDALNACKASTG